MKTKIVPVVSTIFLLSAMIFSVASAKDNDLVNVNANVNVEAQTRDNETNSTENTSVRGNVTNTIKNDDNSTSENSTDKSTDVRDNRATSTDTEKDNATSTNENKDDNDRNTNGQITSLEHRSTVASFVQSLLEVADREGGIGAEVREIAKTQNDSATTTTSAMVKVEDRGSFRTFLLGSDYKNLGVIRSELATTSNNIARLKSILDKTTNTADRVELNTQIQALEANQVKVDAYVNEHEGTFSLFGWFVKLFAK